MVAIHVGPTRRLAHHCLVDQTTPSTALDVYYYITNTWEKCNTLSTAEVVVWSTRLLTLITDRSAVADKF